MNWLGLLFVAVGIYALCGSYFNWDWFMNARKVRFIVSVIGRNRARVFCAVAGLALLVFGILGLTGVIVYES